MPADFPEIVCTDHTLSGSPRLSGRRLAVGDIISLVEEHKETLSALKEEHQLTISQISQALHYCAQQQCIADNPLVFCHNCTLRSQQQGPLDTSDLEEVTHGNHTYVKGCDMVFLGPLSEFINEWHGQERWKIATELLIDLRRELSPIQNQTRLK